MVFKGSQTIFYLLSVVSVGGFLGFYFHLLTAF
jgi:hypothetical protein